MDLEIKGIVPTTMLDWEGKLATTLFVGGCNFRCPWCQNPDLVLRPQELPNVDWQEIETHLASKKDWLDGVVVTGGEPTIQAWLPDLLRRLKVLGYPVKLDTNGSRPKVLKNLFTENLVDCVAMDIKSSLTKYEQVCGVRVDTERIQESINLILSSSIDHEFRTTVVPEYVEISDILEIAGYISGAKKYTLQQFSIREVLDSSVSEIQPYSHDILQNMADEANQYVACHLRT